jgi:NAD(P)-dependent dehydrogenase (short-subunit alcohol dehydrogenase family)
MQLKDKVAIVTGGSRGIGEAIAQRFAQAGAKVVVCSRKIEGVNAAVEAIRVSGGEAHGIACHTGKPEQIEAMLSETLSVYGQADVLVNNAATNPYFGPMMSVQWPAWDKTFEVNVKGYFMCARALIEHLESRGASGSIINVASILGSMASPMQGVYGMTKAAVISMTKTMATELGASKIRMNAIAPGMIETKFSQALLMNEDIKKTIIDRTPLDRVGQPQDIAGAALFLASDESAFMTGEVLTVDGGMTIGSL